MEQFPNDTHMMMKKYLETNLQRTINRNDIGPIILINGWHRMATKPESSSIVQSFETPVDNRSLAIMNDRHHIFRRENRYSITPAPQLPLPISKRPSLLPIKQVAEKVPIKYPKKIHLPKRLIRGERFYRNLAIFFIGCFLFSITIYQSLIDTSKFFVISC